MYHSVFPTRSLHDALAISLQPSTAVNSEATEGLGSMLNVLNESYMVSLETFSIDPRPSVTDRHNTRLNSSHRCISYAVRCLTTKTKKTKYNHIRENHTHTP